jgi:hypothetical protein
VTTFYKKKDEVNLKPGQTLGFTAGKGYYPAGSPTPPKPSPAPAKPSSRAEPTATRPTAAKTPTAPPGRASSPPTTRRPGEPDSDTARGSDARVNRSPASTTPKLSESTAFYRRANDVPLGPGQTPGYAGERGYYAAGRPQPTKAATTPRPSTVKVTALSTRASTESPLVEHRETRDGRTTIRLAHATKPTDHTSQERKVAAHASERSAKPTKEPARRAAVETKKASSRVHEQLAKNKERSHHPKSGIGHHPGHKDGPWATAASAGDAERSRGDDDSGFANNPLFAPFLRFHPWAQWKKSVTFPAGAFAAETTVQASTGTGMSVRQRGDELTVTYGGQKLYAMSLGTFSAGALHVAETAYAVAQKLKKDATDIVTKTVHVDGGDLTVSPSGAAYTKTKKNGVTTSVRSNWLGQLVVSINYTARPPAPRPPLVTRPIHMSVTTTITPNRTPSGPKEPVTVPVTVREHAHQPASNKSDFDAIFAPTPNQSEKALGWLAGGVVGLGTRLASQVEGSGSPAPVPIAGVGHPPKNVA